jgi:hypothetical protein
LLAGTGRHTQGYLGPQLCYRRPNSWMKPRQSLQRCPPSYSLHIYLYSFALRFLFRQTHATSYIFYSSVTVHCKGERRKLGLRPRYNFSGNICFKFSVFCLCSAQAQKLQRNCTYGFRSLGKGVQKIHSFVSWFWSPYPRVQQEFFSDLF